MKVEQMRSEIAKIYEGVKWKNKVKEMPDNQVIAVYHSFLRNNIFNMALKEKESKINIVIPKDHGRTQAYEQMNMFDMVMGCDLASGKDYTVKNGVIK